MSSNGSLLLTVGPALDVGFTVGDRYTSLPAMQTVVASLGAGQEKLRGDLVAVEQKLGQQLSSLQGQVDADVGAVEQKLDDEVSSLQGQVDADVGELEALRQIVSSLQTTVASLAALPAARRVHPIACSNDTPPLGSNLAALNMAGNTWLPAPGMNVAGHHTLPLNWSDQLDTAAHIITWLGVAAGRLSRYDCPDAPKLAGYPCLHCRGRDEANTTSCRLAFAGRTTPRRFDTPTTSTIPSVARFSFQSAGPLSTCP